jgi:HSP20 family protein
MNQKMEERKMATLATWKPMRDLFDIHTDMNRVFDDFFRRTPRRVENADWDWSPAVDVLEADDHYEVRAELPGVSEKDVHVSVTDNILTLRGEKKQESTENGKNYHRVERHYGSFQRSFTLPYGLKTDAIKANFKNGVLSVSVPKPEEVKPKEITVGTE